MLLATFSGRLVLFVVICESWLQRLKESLNVFSSEKTCLTLLHLLSLRSYYCEQASALIIWVGHNFTRLPTSADFYMFIPASFFQVFVCITGFFVVQTALHACSRTIYAFSRDHGAQYRFLDCGLWLVIIPWIGLPDGGYFGSLKTFVIAIAFLLLAAEVRRLPFSISDLMTAIRW